MKRSSLVIATTVIVGLAQGCGTILAISPDSEPAGASPDGGTADGAQASEGGVLDGSGAGDGAGGADGPVDAAADTLVVLGTPKLVFVLRDTVLPATTPLDENGVPHSGRDGFDGRCRADAKAAGLTGTFVAWMSVSAGPGANAIDRLADGVSWFLPAAGPAQPSADLVFPSKSAIPAGPKIGINRGADGLLVTPTVGEERVWTGTDSSGHTVSAQSCGDWVQSGMMGRWGVFNAAGASSWTNAGITVCTNPYRVICFQQ